MTDGVSIVICCYNSEKRLPRVLEHLDRQVQSANITWEVLIVDNASTDRTAEVARELWRRKEIPLRIVHEPKPGLSNARLNGIANSTYDVISFIDDDNWVEPKWVHKVYEIMNSDPSIAILGGRGEAAFEAEPPFWFDKYQAYFAVGSDGKITGKQGNMVTGAGMSIRREAWDYMKSNGFDFILTGRKGAALSSGEDQELCYAFLLAGFDIYYDDDLQFYHFMPDSRMQWDYLVNLFGALGRAAPVIDYYLSLIRDERGIRRLSRSNTVLSTVRSLYKFVLFLPQLILLCFEEKEGNSRVLKFATLRNMLLTKLKLFFLFPTYVSQIRNAGWYKGPPAGTR